MIPARLIASIVLSAVVYASVGGRVGSCVGAHHLPSVWCWRLLAVLVGIAAIKGVVVGP